MERPYDYLIGIMLQKIILGVMALSFYTNVAGGISNLGGVGYGRFVKFIRFMGGLRGWVRGIGHEVIGLDVG